MIYKAVIFDLDGTLLDTAKDIMVACNYTLKKYGYAPLDESLLRTKVTAGMREMLKLGVKKELWETSGIETFMRDCFANYYKEHIADTTIPFNGIENLIKTLHSLGIKTGVVTNKYKDMADKVLSKFEFCKNFELVLGCDSLTHSKPHPEPILTAMQKLQVKACETLYVGDHLNDIKAATAAHTDSAIALWGYGIYECPNVDTWGGTYKVKDVNELLSIIFDKIS